MSENTLPLGVDASSYQGDINIPTFKNQDDIKYAMFRAGISWGFTDPKFYRNWTHVTWLPKIAYHVPYFGEDPNRQMNHFLSIKPLKPNDRLALDLELSHGYGKAFITDRLLQMLYYLKERTGRYPVLYSRANWVDTYLYVDRLPAGLEWWLATYLRRLPSPLFTQERKSPPLLPKGVTSWLIHQTGDRNNGKKRGMQSYYLDSNRWNGTLADMHDWFFTEPPEEPEPPVNEKPLYKAVVKDIAPDRLNVRDAPDGDIIGKLYAGTEVEVWEDAGDWVRIDEGRWVSEQFLQRVVDEEQVEDGLLDVPLWNQRDERWANLKMGDSGITLAEQGCLVTDTASCLSLILGREVTPLEYGTALNNFNGYLRPTNRMYWQMPKYLYGVPLEIYKSFPYGTGWEETVRSMLKKGLPAMGRVDMLPGAGYMQHWVTFLGELNNAFWIHDPWYGGTSLLKARYDKVYHISAYGWKE